jgi:hypothetical protein
MLLDIDHNNTSPAVHRQCNALFISHYVLCKQVALAHRHRILVGHRALLQHTYEELHGWEYLNVLADVRAFIHSFLNVIGHFFQTMRCVGLTGGIACGKR